MPVARRSSSREASRSAGLARCPPSGSCRPSCPRRSRQSAPEARTPSTAGRSAPRSLSASDRAAACSTRATWRGTARSCWSRRSSPGSGPSMSSERRIRASRPSCRCCTGTTRSCDATALRRARPIIANAVAWVRAQFLAFADRYEYMTTDPGIPIPWDGLSSRDYVHARIAAELAGEARPDPAKFSSETSAGPAPAGHSPAGGHTSHMSAGDRDGNLASVTGTILNSWGARLLDPGTGVLLNNGMGYFDLLPGGSQRHSWRAHGTQRHVSARALRRPRPHGSGRRLGRTTHHLLHGPDRGCAGHREE